MVVGLGADPAPRLLLVLAVEAGANGILMDTTDRGPRHRVVAAAHRKHAGLRLVRTGLVLESFIPSVPEQLITTGSAR
ncbi:hypothetical protein [Streptomyces sp. NPDC101178]|uniref:hypothetical protein n=1 Tax=Streptomyces sp. NPDC101178 TaxID=3366124 RepID=UPI0038197641